MQSCDLCLPWFTDPDACEHYGHHTEIAHHLQNKSGITVGQFVEAIRKTLVDAGELIKGFAECLTHVVVNRVEDVS